MDSPARVEAPQSFLGITVRRSFVTGRAYLVYGTVMSSLLGIGLGAASPAAFTSGLPLIFPIFISVGSMGALTVFSNDRLKGVVEYLIAYGVTPRRQFLNVLLASLVLVSVILTIGLGISIAGGLARGDTVTPEMVSLLIVYTIPMSYASVAFASTIGMFWTSLSSPRAGINSPTGLAPFIGVAPPVASLAMIAAVGISAGTVSNETFLLVTGSAMLAVVVSVVVLVSLIDRLLRRERLLSPA